MSLLSRCGGKSLPWRASLCKVKIPIVDDSSTMRRMIGRIIRKSSLLARKILETCDAQKALAILSNHEVGLVLSVINMPGMDGIGMLEEIRQMPGKQKLPVATVAADRTERLISRAIELGAADYVLKPLTIERLVGSLRKCRLSARTADGPQLPAGLDETDF